MITIQMRERWGSYVVDGWRCLICGENIDAVIKSNREARPTGSEPRVSSGLLPLLTSAQGSFKCRGRIRSLLEDC